MLFFVSADDYTNLQNNTTKVKVHLNNGIAEILDQHQDLLGQVENDIVEVETFFENRVEKLLFILQNAVFIVSTKGLGVDREKNKTAVYVYAKRAIPSTVSTEEIVKQSDKISKKLEKLKEKKVKQENAKENVFLTNFRIREIEEELVFNRRVVSILKGLKG
jgi:anion-transporting  ArsA/GET3 family ATPase